MKGINRKMKIVQLEDYFHPDAGYQINILSKYFTKAGNEVTIITSEMEKIPEKLTSFFGRDNIEERDTIYTQKYEVKIIRLPLKAFISGRAVFTNEIFKVVKAEKPDIVFAHGNDKLFGMQYLFRYKKMGYPLIMDNHMLEMASDNKFNKLYRYFYRIFLTPIIVKNKIKVIRTQNDTYVEKCLGIPLKQCPWISVGSDTILFHQDRDVREKFRKENEIDKDAFVILYAGKLDEGKGGQLLADAILKKFHTKRQVVFVIVGKTLGEYGKRVEETFEKSENRILRFPTQKYVDLAKFYQASDLAVFPKQCSLSFYDVQACGIPVVFEDNNINVDRSAYGNGLTFKSGNIDDFRDKMISCVNMEETKYKEMSLNSEVFVKEHYDYANIADEYMRLMEKTIAEYK